TKRRRHRQGSGSSAGGGTRAEWRMEWPQRVGTSTLLLLTILSSSAVPVLIWLCSTPVHSRSQVLTLTLSIPTVADGSALRMGISLATFWKASSTSSTCHRRRPRSLHGEYTWLSSSSSPAASHPSTTWPLRKLTSKR